MQAITAFNNLDSAAAIELLTACLAVPTWAEQIVGARPFETSEQLAQACQDGWWACNETEKLSAFAAHPRIGDVELLRAKYASNAEAAQEKQGLANAEQGQVLKADDAVITELAAQNNRYFDKFGFIFIVFATGKSAAEMLGLLNGRINNTAEQEIHNATVEQEKIMLLRLNNSLQTLAQQESS